MYVWPVRLFELFLEKFQRHSLVSLSAPLLEGAQFDAPNLAGNGLRKVRELQPADPLIGRECPPHEVDNLAGELRAWRVAGA